MPDDGHKTPQASPQKDRPLVSPRSPSYGRAQRVWEEPAPSDSVALGKLLDLQELELAHIKITDGAATWASDELAGFLMASAKRARWRAERLSALIETLGGIPLDEDDAEADLMPHRPGDLASSSDEETLRARLAEQTSVIAKGYREALRAVQLPESIQSALSELSADVA